MSLLEVRELTVSYAGAAEPSVGNLAFSMEPGESLGLVGESGSGKTQTALAIMGLLPPTATISGSICFDGDRLSNQPQKILNRFRARRLAMVFQDPQQALNPYLTIGEQLRRVLLEHRMVPQGAARGRALELLQRVHLPDAARCYDSYPHQLSGGMRQRAMVALALSCGPRLLIADEPTTALDVTVQAAVLALLQELRAATGIALLLITHDLGVIAGNCERMLVMHRGRLLEQGSTKEVFRSPARPETRAMLAAAASLDRLPPARPPDGAAMLRVDRLEVSFRSRGGWGKRGSRGVVKGVTFSLVGGETLAVVGESGCGKSTLARAIAGLLPYDSGSVYLAGTKLAPRVQDRKPGERRSLQMVFQDPVASLNPAMKVGSIVAEPIALHDRNLRGRERHERTVSALARTGLDESLLPRFAHELSGGQAQRVAIARALALEPAVLICDEAVAALDGTVRQAVLDLLLEEQRRSGLSIVFIAHDIVLVRQVAHRVLVMYMGRVVELSDNERLFERPRHPYTRALMDSVPVADPEHPVRRAVMTGVSDEIPGRGCPFHPRCGYALPVCRAEMPVLRTVAGVEVACHRAEELDLRFRERRPGHDRAPAD